MMRERKTGRRNTGKNIIAGNRKISIPFRLKMQDRQVVKKIAKCNPAEPAGFFDLLMALIDNPGYNILFIPAYSTKNNRNYCSV
jgi:hypothetical protein